MTELTTDVPTPIEAGLPYEEVKLTTPDGLTIRGYVIPARRNPVPLSELRGLSSSAIAQRGTAEQVAWMTEKDTEGAIEVGTCPEFWSNLPVHQESSHGYHVPCECW